MKTMKRLNSTLLLLSFLTASGCSGQGGKQQTSQASQPAAFTLPKVPIILQTPEEITAFLVSHYWDNFNFADTSLSGKADITEQAFADYVNFFPHTTNDVIEKSVSSMLHEAMTGSEDMFLHFEGLYEKYLYNPNSPFRNDAYYIIALQSIIADKLVDESFKIRPRYQLEMALKNRQGTIANDFGFTLGNGRKMKLSQVSGSYTVLFFNNPDCQECEHMKEVLSRLTVPGVRIVAIYPDEDVELWKKAAYPKGWVNGYIGQESGEQQSYDLRAIPCLYLLDKDKKVILKDARVEELVNYFQATD